MTLMILKMIGCLALLMFGMKTMSEGLQKLTGGHLRTVLGTMTKHRLGGLLTGTAVLRIPVQHEQRGVAVLCAWHCAYLRPQE